jgi:bacterial/archaeal transporter family-2 protein
LSLEIWSEILKATLWFVALACGCFQVVQAMSNGSAVRSGLGPIWVGAMSATVSTLSLILVAVAIYRLPLPDTSLVIAHGWKVVVGGMMGAFLVAGLAFVAPRLGPTQTFMLYFAVIAVSSVLIDGFGLLGTEARPLEPRQLVGVLLAGVGLMLARA